MIDNISLFDNGQSAASINSSKFTSESAKTSGFEQALNAAAETGEKEKIMEAAREFESYFLQMMLKEMRNSVPKDGLIPKNNAEEIFQSMLDEEYSKNAAKGKGMGIAQMIFEQMTRNNQTPLAPQRLRVTEGAEGGIKAGSASDAASNEVENE